MLIYQAIITAVLALLLLNTLVNLRLLRRPGILTPDRGGEAGLAATATGGRGELDDRPLVSILIPARNEARAIARCVESLARQDYPRCEVLVLDDHSTDQTAAIVAELAARYPRVRLLRGEPLPPGWHGKAFACAQLARAARGGWLLFADADTVHAPHCVSTALAVARRRRAALLTLIPRMIAGSFGEALLLPTTLLTFAGVLPLGLVTTLPSPLVAGAFGPFMLFRRDAYEQLGGHEAVRADIVEDMQLSRLVKRGGGRVVWIDGTDLVSTRLYYGLAEAWQGFAKSAFAATNYSLPGLLVGAPLCAAFLFAPYGFVAAALVGGHVGSVALFWLPLCQIAAILASYALLLWRFRLPLVMVAFHAATVAAIILFTLYSAYQATLGGGVTWKGRTYDFGARRHGVRLRSRIQLAVDPALARLLLAALLVVLGWRAGGSALRLAVLMPLAGWTLALLEHARRRDPAPAKLAPIADLALGVAALVYLQLSGLFPLGLALVALALSLLAFRLFAWRTGAAVTSALLGGLLLLAAGTYAPMLDALPLLWCAAVMVLARRPIAQAVSPWIHRLRP
ncbi:MAG TPA: glycosyltransferase [Ktedonobacterales bacterium]